MIRSRQLHRFASIALLAFVAATALADAPDGEAVRRAIRDLQSDDWVLQWAAIKQLTDWKHPEAPSAFRKILAAKGNDWIRGRALVALAQLEGKAARAEVARASTDPSEQLRAAAVDAMGSLGPGADPTLQRMLKDRSKVVRLRAVVAVARIREAKAWAIVQPLLESKDPLEVVAASEAAAFVRTVEADARLMKLLAHEDPRIRAAAAGTLGSARVAPAIELLLKQIATDTNASVKRACRTALNDFDMAVLQPRLLKILADEKLAALYPAAMSVFAERPTTEGARRIAAMLKADPKRYSAVLPAALRLLAGVNADAYHGVFETNLHHVSRDVRVAAVRGIARCRNADLYADLAGAILDTDSRVRVAAYKVIRHGATHTPTGGIVPYLYTALQHDNGAVRSAALDLLGERLKPAELPAAIDALDVVLAGSSSALRNMACRTFEPMIDEPTARRVAQRQGFITQWRILGPYAGPVERTYDPQLRPRLAEYPLREFGKGAAFAVASAVSDGVTKSKALRMLPPDTTKGGKTVARYTLALPQAARLTLRYQAALDDAMDDDGDGAALEIWAGDKRVALEKFDKPAGWAAGQIDLTGFAGRTVALRFVADALARNDEDRIALAEPQIVAGSKVVHDLAALATKAALWIETSPPRKAAWTPARTSGMGASLLLHDLLRSTDSSKLAYASVELRSTVAQEVRLQLYARDAFRLWVNGEKVGESNSYGSRTMSVKLTAGVNRLLLKIAAGSGHWYTSVRVCDKKGARIDTVSVVPVVVEK